jgi:hypothetical protein
VRKASDRRPRYDVELTATGDGRYDARDLDGRPIDLASSEPLCAAAEHFLKKGASNNDLLIAWADGLSAPMTVGTAHGVPLAELGPALQERRSRDARFANWRPIRQRKKFSEHLLPEYDHVRRHIARLYQVIEIEAPCPDEFWQRHARGGRTSYQGKSGEFYQNRSSSSALMTKQDVKTARTLQKHVSLGDKLYKLSPSEHELAAKRNQAGLNKGMGRHDGHRTPAEERALELKQAMPITLRRREVTVGGKRGAPRRKVLVEEKRSLTKPETWPEAWKEDRDE